MVDFTKAGLDRGDLQKELEHTLISARMIYRTYRATIEDLTKEELEHDLRKYSDQISRFIIPFGKESGGNKK